MGRQPARWNLDILLHSPIRVLRVFRVPLLAVSLCASRLCTFALIVSLRMITDCPEPRMPEVRSPMPRKGSDFAGLSVAIVTPFKNGEVDYARLQEQVEFQIAAGTACLVPVGTTGESPTLSHEEHERVI